MKATILSCVAAGACLFARAETIDALELTGDTSITIPSGETRHVEYLTATGFATLSVSGGGTLELAVVDDPRISLVASGGRVRFVRPAKMSPPANAIFHLDANDASSFEWGTARDGVPAVRKWFDTDGNQPFDGKGTFYAGMSTASQQPLYRTDFVNGLPAVDFGQFCHSATPEGAKRPHIYLSFHDSLETYGVTVRDSFVVWCDDPTAKMLATTNNATFYGPQPLGASCFWRGAAGRGVNFNLLGATGFAPYKGVNILDGAKVASTTLVNDGWHVWQNTASTGGATFGCLTMSNYNKWGGVRIGEAWCFSDVLSEADAARIRAYLASKWLGPRLRTIELKEGATLEKCGAVRAACRGLSGSVWDDCQFALGLAEDANGDGRLQSGEWLDLRRPNETWRSVVQGHISTSPAWNTNALFVTHEDVALGEPTPYGSVLTNYPCIRCVPPETTNTTTGVVKYKRTQFVFDHPDASPVNNPVTGTNDIYTMLFRFKVNGYRGCNSATILTANKWGKSAEAGGPLLRVCPKTSDLPDFSTKSNYWDVTRGTLTVNVGSPEMAGGAFPLVTNGVWHELAFIASNRHVTIMMTPPGDRTTVREKDFDSSWAMNLSPHGTLRLFDESYGEGTLDPRTGYVGSDMTIQQFALWSRTLSFDEVREAFSGAGSAVVRVGRKGLSEDLFGTATNVTGEIEVGGADRGDWRAMPQTIGAGGALHIPFRVPRGWKGMPQYLRLTTKAGSAEGAFKATIGSFEGEIVAKPGRTEALYCPATCFAEDGTLVLRRTDAGAGAVAIEAIEIQGSWGMGSKDVARNLTMSSESFARPNFSVNDRNTKNLSYAITVTRTNGVGKVVSGTGKEVTLRFTVPEELAGMCRATYHTRFGDAYFNSANANVGMRTMPCVLRLNGKVLGEWDLGDVRAGGTALTRKVDIPVALRSVDLLPGENTLVWKVDGETFSAHSWVCFDYHTLELSKPRGGAILILK